MVVLAGAGPGDAELITVKLQKRLAEAEVIIVDRLVNPAIITLYANPSAQIIHAGKQGYNNDSFSQEQVTALIIEHATKGKKVLRLKGGDIAFFSNVLDELQALTTAAIPYEIIPGITAASGASAYTGIPLTARGISQGVQLLSFNPTSDYTEQSWQTLAESNDTLVFYMAGKNIALLAEQLLRYNNKQGLPVAVIEQATTTQQKIHVSTLQNCNADFEKIQFGSPTLVIIGEVVNLHQQFNWFTGSGQGSVFRELKQEATPSL